MKMLEKAATIQDIIDNIPCMITDKPDIMGHLNCEKSGSQL